MVKQQRAEFAEHWRVEDGALVNDGHGPYATSDEEFGDIEFHLEYKTVPKADSGIYLRGAPQVQIWDHHQVFNPKNPTRKPHLGSGGLFNNSPGAPGQISVAGGVCSARTSVQRFTQSVPRRPKAPAPPAWLAPPQWPDSGSEP